MLYLSKGAVLKPSNINNVHVSRCGIEHILHGTQAKVWLAGRFGTANADKFERKIALRELETMGLVELTEDICSAATYRLLTNCVICLASQSVSFSSLKIKEQQILKWINKAGFKLTISELVYLTEKNIKPESSLVGKENWSALVGIIYTTETIFDGILMAKMEEAHVRNDVVLSVLGLLRKKRIILL